VEGTAGPDFEAFYRAEFDRVVRAVFVIVGGRDEAFDIAQEAFARAWAHWHRIRRRDAPVVFVLVVARNLSNSHLRRLIRGRRALTDLENEARGERATSDDVVLCLPAALAELPSRQRWAVVLCDLLDLSSDQAASILRIAPSTVRVHLSRGRSRLRDRLAAPSPGHSAAAIDEPKPHDKEART
jgi:RNA polymerase sigma-70 factor (ECF subfamily)